MTEVPSTAYVFIGSLIVANIGTVISVIYGVGRLVWWLSKLDARVASIETHHAKDINIAFQKIRDLEQKTL